MADDSDGLGLGALGGETPGPADEGGPDMSPLGLGLGDGTPDFAAEAGLDGDTEADMDGIVADAIDESRLADEVAAVVDGGTPATIAATVSRGPPATPGGGIGRNPSRSSTGVRATPDRGRLWARVPEPVEGSPLVPFVSLRTDDGRIVRGEDGGVTLRWSRSKGKDACAFPLCPSQGSAGSRTTVQAAGLEAGRTGRGQFCSVRCFTAAWSAFVAQRPGEDGPAGEAGRRAGGASASASASASGGAAAGKAAEAYGVAALLASGADAKGALPSLADVVAAAADPSTADGLSASERAFASAELARTAPQPSPLDSEGWEVVGMSDSYTPTPADVLHRLRVEVTARPDGGTPLIRTVDTTPVVALPRPPPRRTWLPLTHDPITKTPLPRPPGVAETGDRTRPRSVRVVSFNVLAEIYCSRAMYPYCPGWALAFDYRKHLLARQLEAMDADIVCLQETQADHFRSFFGPMMRELGYEGLYKQKNRESMGVDGKMDGCATFYRTSRFNLIAKYNLDFNEAVRQCCEGEAKKAEGLGQRDAEAHLQQVENIRRRLTHDNVAQVLVLEMVTSPTGEALPEAVPLCVANTHLFWDPEYADVKLWQTHKLLGELEKSMVVPHDYPIILCGDFNSEPASAVHQLLAGNMRAGRQVGLAPEQLPRDPLSILSMHGSAPLSHPIFLASAYASVLSAEPRFTNYTQGYVGCLDYIWCSAKHITPLAILAIPAEDELRGPWHTPLPNPQHPSDHLALCADLLIGTPSMAPQMRPAAPRPGPFPGMGLQGGAAAGRGGVVGAGLRGHDLSGRGVM